MTGARDRALGFFLVPAAAYVGSSVALGARNAMAPPPHTVDPEEVRLRKQLAYVLAGAAVGSLVFSRSRIGSAGTRHAAEGAALGSAIAAAIAYIHAIRTERAAFVLPVPGAPPTREIPRPLLAPPPQAFQSLLRDPRELVVDPALAPPTVAERAGPRPMPPPMPPRPVAAAGPGTETGRAFWSPPSSATPAAPSAAVRYLTGEQLPSDATLASTIAAVRARLADMDAFYTFEWYPRTFGTSRPDIPQRLGLNSHYRSFGDQAQLVADFLRPLRPASGWTDETLRAALLESLRLRSIPGFSRHHWGTDVDVVAAPPAAWRTGGALTQLIPFMRDEAPRFGFYNPYAAGRHPEPARPHFEPEPWHLSYFAMAEPLRRHWLATLQGPDLAALYDRAAVAIAREGDVPTDALRRILPTLDLVSYVRNVAPVPAEVTT